MAVIVAPGSAPLFHIPLTETIPFRMKLLGSYNIAGPRASPYSSASPENQSLNNASCWSSPLLDFGG